MKKLGVITHNGMQFDDVLLVVIMQFNELARSNRTVTYQDIDITHRMFNRYYAVLVYEYDDAMFGEPDIDPEALEFDDGNVVHKYIGMPPGLDPHDPDWREKLQAYNYKKNMDRHEPL